MMRRILAGALPLGAALVWATPAAAQDQSPASEGAERIKQVIVYGEDPCPAGTGDEIVVCARQAESERFRIPQELRSEPAGSTKNEAWTRRVQSIEYVGRSGTESCSTTGGGGFTGCFEKIMAQAKAERKLIGGADWSNLVAAERAKRLSNIDEESKTIEARVKAEEEARARAEAEQQNGNAASEPSTEPGK